MSKQLSQHYKGPKRMGLAYNKKLISKTKSPREQRKSLRIPVKNINSLKWAKEIYAFSRLVKTTLRPLLTSVEPELVDGLADFVTHLYQSKGPEFVVRFLKATHESVQNLIFKEGHTLVHEGIRIGLDSIGWPKWLGSGLKSKVLQEDSLEHKRLIFTIVSMRRLITIKTNSKYQSITDAPTSQMQGSDFNLLLSGRLGRSVQAYSKRIRNPRIGEVDECSKEGHITSYRVPRLYLSMKSSPNGIAMFSWSLDRLAIIQSGLKEKLTAFAENYFSGPAKDWVEDKLTITEKLVDSNRPLHVGKITLTYEGGKLKPRIFAIVDSLTQTLLQDFHDDLMGILKSIPEDCTFNHDKVSKTAKDMWSKGIRFYGYADLSNATDRLPSWLYEVIGNLLKPQLGTEWLSLFDRPFTISQSAKVAWDTSQGPCPSAIKYATGQPMGALSSWPFMALVHHVLIWCAFGSKEAASGRYHILGDDVVIFNETAYRKYCELLDKLAVTYTNSVSREGFEFAKRLFHKGKEITGAYTQALWASRNVPEIFALEWRNLQSRGYTAGSAFPPQLWPYLKVGAVKRRKIEKLLTVPSGTDITVNQMLGFSLHWLGRMGCMVKSEDRKLQAIKATQQAASFLIQQRFATDLDQAKRALEHNRKSYAVALKAWPGLIGQEPSVLNEMIDEVTEETIVRIRYLERDLKRLYLQPTNKGLLRPNLPDIPRFNDFKKSDSNIDKLKVRAQHQLDLIDLLSSEDRT